MKNKKQLVIIGGGSSLSEGISKGLWKKLENKFTFGLNYSFNHFIPTAQIYVDKDFYEKQIKNGLQKLPLVIGKYHKDNKKIQTPNTITIKAISNYNRNIKHGIYKSSLVGLYALTLGIYLLDRMEGDDKEIFLLGYDYSSQGKDKKGRENTHYYQEDPKLQHRGCGKINYYVTKNRAQKDFAPYKEIKDIKIYNVSMNSHIPTFPKITYIQFFSMLTTRPQNQVQLRTWIRTQLKNVEEKK